MRKTVEQVQFEQAVAYRYETSLYRVALNTFIDNQYSSFLNDARRSDGDFSLELFKTGTCRILRGRNCGGKRHGGGWVIPLFTVDVDRANEVLNKELSYSRGN